MLLCSLLVRVGGEAGEQDRIYPPRKIHFPKGPNLARGVCVTGVMAQSKSDFSGIVSKLCLISQTLLLFHSWLPLPCFIDTVFPTAHVQNRLLVWGLFWQFFWWFIYKLFIFVFFFLFSTCVCDSPRICCVLSQFPVDCWQLLSVPGDYH